MQLRLNQNPNTIQKHNEPIVAVYLEVCDDGGIELCADTDKEWGFLLAKITPDGKFVPNQVGAKHTGLTPDYTFFQKT